VSELPPALPGKVAGLGRRLGALVIDWLVSTGVALLIVGASGYLSNQTSLATLLVFAVEVTVFTWLIGASFGQRLLGLSVVRIDGQRLSFGRALLRTLLICLVIPAVVMDSYGRGLHDRAVGSVVIRST
jgi:uncharacterized RDD family membrane protein YckC